MIPKSFEIFGHTIKVKYFNDLVQRTDNVGEASFRTNEIHLQKNCKGVQRPESQMEQSFWHEAVHMIFNQLNEPELRGNEKLVDMVGSCIQQILKTAKY